MPKKKPYARIAITLPPGVLASADHLARDLDRSRSWVVAEAIRQYAVGQAAGAGHLLREPLGPGYAATTIEQGRTQQLHAALRLTPAERLERAEELVRLARLVRPPVRRAQVIGFDTLEDFAAWKAAGRVSP